MPRFSIVMPCFNAATTLPETLASLRAQTFSDWELLCVDDGSSDATLDLIQAEARRDTRVRVLRNPGKGPSAARNLALPEARGDILAFCDADDLWEPEKLACLVAAFAEPSVAAVFAQVAFFDGTRSSSVSTVPAADLTVPMLLAENPVCTMSNLAVRREVFSQTGGFDTRLVHNEDLEWLIRLVATGHRVVGLDRCLVRYRTSVSGLSSDLGRMRAGRRAALATAERFGFRADPRAEAIYCRYLARRALRVGAPGVEALRFVLTGLILSPVGFLSDLRRGGLTVAAALCAPVLPGCLRQFLFAG